MNAGLTATRAAQAPFTPDEGVAQDGRRAPHPAPGGCAPGLVVVNIGSGFGASCTAFRRLGEE